MISATTTRGVVKAIEAWERSHQIDRATTQDLIERLTEVQGNKSYRDSVNGLLTVIARD
jgi:hypothetical protein